MTTLPKRWVSSFTILAFLTTSLVPLAPVYAGGSRHKHKTIHSKHHSEEPSVARPARAHRLTVEEILQEPVQTATPSSKSWISDWLPGFVQDPLSYVVETLSSLLGSNIEKTTIDEAVASLAALPREAAHTVIKGVKYAVKHPGETLVFYLSAYAAAVSASKGFQTQEDPMDALLSRRSERFSLIGNNFLINQNTNENQYNQWTPYNPSIATLSNGNPFVVWSGNATGIYQIYGRVFTSNGTALGNEFTISQVTAIGNKGFPAITALSNGNAFIVWDSTQTGYYNIYGRVFDPNGMPLSNDFPINQNTILSDQQHSSITALNSGNAFVAWSSSQTGDWDIYGNVFAPNGTALANEFTINQNTTGSQIYPSVATLNNGNTFVVWESDQNGNWDVYGRLFAPNGTALSNELSISQITTGDIYSSIAALSNGNAFIAWTDIQTGDYYSIYGRIFAPNGTALGNEFQIDQFTTGAYQSIAALNNGNAFIVWGSTQTEDYNIYGRLFAPNGTALDNKFQINQFITDASQGGPTVALSNGNAFVVWATNHTGNSDIYGQIFDFSDPMMTTASKTFPSSNSYILPLLLGLGGATGATCLGLSLVGGGCAVAGGVYGVKKYKEQQKHLKNSPHMSLAEESGIKAQLIVGENKRQFQLIDIMDTSTFQKLEKFTGVPFDEAKIRAGAHGTVKPAVEINPETRKPSAVVAAKFIKGEQLIAYSKNEIEILTALGKSPQNNPYTSYLLDAYLYNPQGDETFTRSFSDVTKIIFTPWFAGGDGDDLIKRLPSLTNTNDKEKLLTSLIRSLYCAVSYLNGQEIYHNDINPGNLLIDMETANFRLSDFGSATKSKILNGSERIRRGYESPEFLAFREKKTTIPANAAQNDSWSSTVVSWQFFFQSSKSPFHKISFEEMEGAITQLAQQNTSPTNGMGSTLIEVFQKRLIATEALALSLFSEQDPTSKEWRIHMLMNLITGNHNNKPPVEAAHPPANNQNPAASFYTGEDLPSINNQNPEAYFNLS